MSDDRPEKILVIRLGALGDFVLSTGLFKAIRQHHSEASVTLLTTAPYLDFARQSNWFDEIWIDRRRSPWRADIWLSFALRLRRAGFQRVYDLQRSERTGWYFRLLGRDKPEWVGVVPGCSHRYHDPPEKTHILDRLNQMVIAAGIDEIPGPDLSFLTADLGRFDLTSRHALLVPGSSAHRLDKRWPAESYSALARVLAERGIVPVLICGPAERQTAREIIEGCPEALWRETTLAEIAELARGACCAVGNDTGPMHIIAAQNCPSVVLFSKASDPVRQAPRGARATILQSDTLSELSLDEVLAACREHLGGRHGAA